MFACSSALLAGSDVVPALVMGIGGGVAIVAIIASNIRATRVAGYNARLKQMMIERGMSADEIERVIRTSSDKRDCRPGRHAQL